MGNVFFLQDLKTDSTNAIVITKTSTEDEIRQAILKLKQDANWNWEIETLVNCLPNDCAVYNDTNQHTITKEFLNILICAETTKTIKL